MYTYLYFYAYFINIILIIYYYFLESPYGKTKRVYWSQKEQEAALKAFAKCMENLKLPSLKEIQEVKKNILALLNAHHYKLKHDFITNKKLYDHVRTYYFFKTWLFLASDHTANMIPRKRKV